MAFAPPQGEAQYAGLENLYAAGDIVSDLHQLAVAARSRSDRRDFHS
jgi:hypothetical protein